MEIQQAYKQAAQLKEWNAKIELLGARVEIAGADMAVKHAEALRALHAKQRTAAEKTQELENATGVAWGQVKETADKVWDDLKAGVAEAHAKSK